MTAHRNRSQTPVMTTLSDMPSEMTDHILEFIPESVRVWRAVSRAFQRVGEGYLQELSEEIVRLCSDTGSPLYILTREMFDVLSSHWESHPNCSHLEFHFFVQENIVSLGVPPERCPARILSAQEIAQFNDEVQTAQDACLKGAWFSFRHQIREAYNFQLAGIPGIQAAVQEARSWMGAEANQPTLERMTRLNLSSRHLTCMPMEICLFTGLRELDLSSNELFSLPEWLFQEVAGLQKLNLYDNKLTSLPGKIFQGLGELQELDLSGNLLTSLPEGLFQGLAGLRHLYLIRNRLAFLPERIFQGLVGLKSLSLARNQLVSFPEGLFHGLGDLQRLFLYNNPRLLFFYEDLTNENNIESLQTVDAFFSYECISPFAKLYQLIAGNPSPDAVRELFSQLPVPLQNVILERVSAEAGHPDTRGEPRWREHHVFGTAMKRYVRENFEGLTQDRKHSLYYHAFTLAQRERETENVHVYDLQWEEQPLSDNILRLIDALNCEIQANTGNQLNG